MVYLIAFIMALIAALLNNRMSPALRKSVLAVICIYVIIIIGFRYKVGIDTFGYMSSFRRIPTLDHLFTPSAFESTRYEPGFFFVCSFCKSLTNEFWPVQLIMATITNSCIFIFLYKYSRNVFVGVLFYFLLRWLYFSTEIIRESAAISIFLLNFKNLEEKKWVKYYLLSIISISFHYSAAIIWFFPFIKLLRNNLLFYSLCVLFLLITPFVERLNELLQIAAVYERIDRYTTNAENLNINWRIGELVRSAFPAIAAIVGYKIAKEKVLFENLLKMQIIFCMGAFAIPLIFSRFTNYTSLFVVVALANLLSINTIRNWIKILLVSFVILTQANYYHYYYRLWIPYSSIFYPENSVDRHKMYRDIFLEWMKKR